MIKVSAFRSLNRTRREMDSITAWFVVGLFSATFVCSAVTQLIDTYTNSSANPLWFQLVGTALGVVHVVIETSVYFIFGHVPHKLFGPFAIASIQGVTAFCALIFG
ncbi:unnamed protein product [Camellia sinensis]